ncbi:MAG: hypothetical protein E7361_04685 [Clostridiales bacterium]|nr:hypothetical protein [Clostridiales bacterium]
MDKNSNNQDKQKKIVSMNSAMQNLKSMVAKNKTTSSEQPTATIVYNKPTSKIDEDMQKLSQDISTKEIVTEIEESTESVKKEAKSIEEKPAKTVDNSEFAPKILDDTNEYDDIKKTKKYAWLAYILFFIPLLINRKSKFVRLHANEGLEIFIFDLLATALILTNTLITFSAISSIIGIICKLFGVGLFILTGITKIFQIIQVIRGKATQTPWLWKSRMIK